MVSQVLWARLEDAGVRNVKEFVTQCMEHEKKTVAEHHDHKTDTPRTESPEGLYVHDWSLPACAPDICEELTIPVPSDAQCYDAVRGREVL